jgi:hypothetical protein
VKNQKYGRVGRLKANVGIFKETAHEPLHLHKRILGAVKIMDKFHLNHSFDEALKYSKGSKC